MKNKPRTNRLSRRDFAAIVANAAMAAPALCVEQSAPPAPGGNSPSPQARPAPGNFQRPIAPDTPAFEEPLMVTRKDIQCRAEPFQMTQVRLLPGSVYYNAQEWNRGYMARLAADRLLYTFRANAGLPTSSAKPLGGWEQPDNGQRSSELRGHFLGHYLSASAQLAVNGDKEAKAKGDYMVAEL